MSIRLQLLVVALTTLVLPWAGCQYANQLEGALRNAQEQALQSAAGTIANALSAQAQRVFRRDGTAAAPFSAAAGDLYAYPLLNQPLLDGYREDWGVTAAPVSMPSRDDYQASAQVASTEHYLYLYVEVADSHFDPEPLDVNLERDHFDRLDVTLQAPDGGRSEYFFGTDAPGALTAQAVLKADNGATQTAAEPRIQAFWLQTAKGYHLEARIPLSMVGPRIWIEARDGTGERRAGVAAEDRPEGGRLFFATDGLGALLATFIRAGTRAIVVDTNSLKLGSAGSLTSGRAADEERATPWYRHLMAIDTRDMPHVAAASDRLSSRAVREALAGRPSAQWVLDSVSTDPLLTAAAPIVVDGRTQGVVYLEQAADQLLALRDQALSQLFNFTLLTTGVAVAVMLLFATWLSVRLGRLRNAADSAITNDGRIRLSMPESGARDEIGDLARGFERLLGRLNEHAQYLRTLGGKLSHELRTPLTIVRSSLDNLESEGLRAEQRRYIDRARDGTGRLQSILSALGAAARVEESIKQTDRVSFDLRELVASAFAGYRDGFPNTTLVLALPPDPCFARGAPDLLVQLLDKLIENAVDFCPPAGAVTVRLEREREYLLSVANDGPLIPDATLAHLFESLFEQRAGRDDKPHFGLGLYIVRLVAEFHGGVATAANRSDGGGVVFTVRLPLI